MNYKNADGTWAAIGIVSYDFNPFVQGTEETFLNCKTGPSTPRSFTRVSSYVDWILVIMNDGISRCSSTTDAITTNTSPFNLSTSPLTTQLTTSSYSSATTSLPTSTSSSSSSSFPSTKTVSVIFSLLFE